jgi:cell division protein FtsB
VAAKSEVNLGIWSALTRAVTFLLFAAGVLAVLVWYKPLFAENQRLRAAVLRLENEIKQEEEVGKRIRAAIDAVSRDPKTVERLAREKFSFAKPGETVIRFDAAAPAPNRSRP